MRRGVRLRMARTIAIAAAVAPIIPTIASCAAKIHASAVLYDVISKPDINPMKQRSGLKSNVNKAANAAPAMISFVSLDNRLFFWYNFIG